MMRRVLAVLLSIVAVLALFVPFSAVLAETSYYEMYPGSQTSVVASNNGRPFYLTWPASGSTSGNTRVVITNDYSEGTSSMYMYFFKESGVSGNLKRTYTTGGSYNMSYGMSKTWGGITYSYGKYIIDDGSATGVLPVLNASSVDDLFTQVYGSEKSYTPAELSYTTNIAGKGTAVANNLDTISWDGMRDSSGVLWSDYDDARIDIAAVPGTYTGTTMADLLQRTYQDFLLDQHFYTVALVRASEGSASVQWSDVIDTVQQFTLSSLVPSEDAQTGIWTLHGWVYQVRVVDASGREGPWQLVYAATSSGAEAATTIYSEGDTYSQTLVQALQQIQTVNQTYNNQTYITNYTYYMQGAPVAVDPEYTSPSSESDKPWWAYLLESIGKGIASIIGGIGKLFSGIGDLFSGVFEGIPDIELQFNNATDGTILQAPGDLVEGLPGAIQSMDSNAHFIVSWPGIELYGVDFIPASSWDLSSFSDALGIDHSMIYAATDAFVWITLIVTVSRRVIAALRR